MNVNYDDGILDSWNDIHVPAALQLSAELCRADSLRR